MLSAQICLKVGAMKISLPYLKSWEASSRCPRGASDKLEQQSFLFFLQTVYQLPKSKHNVIRGWQALVLHWWVHVMCKKQRAWNIKLLKSCEIPLSSWSGVPYTLAKLAICYRILHFGYQTLDWVPNFCHYFLYNLLLVSAMVSNIFE